MKKNTLHAWIAVVAMLLLTFPAIAQETKSVKQSAPEFIPQLEHGTAVQIKAGYWLFQMEPRNDTHILVYINEALDSKGERIGWKTTQLAGEFGNSVDLLPKFVKGEDFPHKKEFEETLRLAHLLEFMLDGKIDPSFWKGKFVHISGDLDLDFEVTK